MESFKAGPKPRSQPLARALRCLSVLLTIVAMGAIVLILATGTFTMKKDDKMTIGLSQLSMVQFDGIIPTKEGSTDSYDVKLFWNLASFSWEYPNAFEPEQSAGIVYKGAFGTDKQLTMPRHFRDVAERLDLPGSDTQCLSSPSRDCTNVFFQQYKNRRSDDWVSSTFQWVLCIYAILTLFITLVKELMISCAPASSGCHCCVGSLLCPSPKCPKDRLAYLAPSAWDSVRGYWYVLSAGSSILTGVFLTIRAKYLVDELKERRISSARIGTGFLGVMWAAVAAMIIAATLIYVARSVNRSAEVGREFPSPSASGRTPVVHSQPQFVPPYTQQFYPQEQQAMPQPQLQPQLQPQQQQHPMGQSPMQPPYSHHPEWKQDHQADWKHEAQVQHIDIAPPQYQNRPMENPYGGQK